MTEPNVWDNPALGNSDYIKFENVGDHAAGTILDISVKTWPDGAVSPQLILQEDGGVEPRTLTATQFELKQKLRELRPNVGDRIAVVFTDIEKLAGGKTLKHFDVNVAAAGAPSAPTAAAPAAAPAAGVSAQSLLG